MSFLKNFIAGIGSILTLFPEPPTNPIAGKSTEELIARNWQRVGDNLRKAMGNIDRELETKNQESPVNTQ